MAKKKLPRWKMRAPGFPAMTEGEAPWGNGCECGGCRQMGTTVARCFDGVVRELCAEHYCSRNLEDPNQGAPLKLIGFDTGR